MTTNFDLRVWWSKWWKFVIGFVSALVLFYLIQVIFFSKDEVEPSGRDYKKENAELQREIDRLRLDSLEQRQELQEEISESEDEADEYKYQLRQLEKRYGKLNYKTHTFDELDSSRERVLPNNNQE